MDFSKRIKQARIEAGLTQTEVSAHFTRLGYAVMPYAISSWETGKHKPDLEYFAVLCKIYKADAAYLLSGKPSLQEEPLLRGLNMKGREHALRYIELLKADPVFTDEEKIKSGRVFRLYDISVSAGTGTYLDGEHFEEMTADELIPRGADYAVRVSGDSMEPRFHDGQIVFIKEQQTLEDGEIGIFALGGASYLKKLLGGALISLNPRYEPIALREYDDFHIFGKVIGAV